MTVRVSKPAFNLRNKLTESDYGTIPYHKMPPGTIIQQTFLMGPTGGAETQTTSTSFTDAGHFQNLRIAPKFIDSLILVEWWFQVKKTRGNQRYHYVRCVRVEEDNSDRQENLDYSGNGIMFWGHYDGDDDQVNYMPVSLAEVDAPLSTGMLRYKLMHKVSNSDTTVRLGENGQTRKLFGRATEIRSCANFEEGLRGA